MLRLLPYTYEVKWLLCSAACMWKNRFVLKTYKRVVHFYRPVAPERPNVFFFFFFFFFILLLFIIAIWVHAGRRTVILFQIVRGRFTASAKERTTTVEKFKTKPWWRTRCGPPDKWGRISFSLYNNYILPTAAAVYAQTVHVNPFIIYI